MNACAGAFVLCAFLTPGRREAAEGPTWLVGQYQSADEGLLSQGFKLYIEGVRIALSWI